MSSITLFMLLNLLIFPASNSIGSGEVSMLKQAWFECGLLDRYSIEHFLQVLEDFNFDSVLIDPFKLDEYGFQTEICEGVYELCNAVDLHAEQNGNFTKFLIVGGGSTFRHSGLVGDLKDSGYVMVMDDSGTDFNATREILQYLKSLNVETGLVLHPPKEKFEPVKDLINESLIDYLMPCFYPYFTNINNFAMYAEDLEIYKTWCNNRSKFLPAIQVFSAYCPLSNIRWRFPTPDEIQGSLDVLIDLNPYGITWFLPHSGESLRGETFEGFLDHAEIWDIIKNPMKKDISPVTPKQLVLIAVAILTLIATASAYIAYRSNKTRERIKIL